MTVAAPAITHVEIDDPMISRLVRHLDADLIAHHPDDSCTGGAHIDPAIRFLLAEADGRPIGC